MLGIRLATTRPKDIVGNELELWSPWWGFVWKEAGQQVMDRERGGHCPGSARQFESDFAPTALLGANRQSDNGCARLAIPPAFHLTISRLTAL